MGFALVSCDKETSKLVERLVRPMEVAMSLSEIDANFMQDTDEMEKVWFHSESGNDLVIWRAEDGIAAWELSFESNFVSWSRGSGFASGTISTVDDTSVLAGFSGGHKQRDPETDESKKTFALDVIAALQAPIREELVDSVS